MIEVAVDAMGGDRAPGVVVEGVLQSLEAYEDLRVCLVGQPEAITPLLTQQHERLEVVPASDVIGMDESPGKALRRKPDASVAVCARLLKEKRVQALVSAGNTGAAIAATMFAADRIRGVRRPGIAASLPNAAGKTTTLIDVGANIHCKPIHFMQYAVMGSAWCEDILGIEKPRVGLLSIGEEDSKGGAAVSQARDALEAAAQRGAFEFVGAVEGNHVFEGVCDVVVCDGFVGNVLLKAAEGIGRTLLTHFVNAMGDQAAMVKQGAERLNSITDYSEYGGAPLLGIQGCAIIAHGRSGPRAISNAIRVAREFAHREVVKHIETRLEALSDIDLEAVA